MKKRNLIVLAALASCMATWAQTYEKTDNGVKFQTASPVLNGEVVFYAPSIVRVVKYPSAEMPEKLCAIYCTCSEVSVGRDA